MVKVKTAELCHRFERAEDVDLQIRRHSFQRVPRSEPHAIPSLTYCLKAPAASQVQADEIRAFDGDELDVREQVPRLRSSMQAKLGDRVAAAEVVAEEHGNVFRARSVEVETAIGRASVKTKLPGGGKA